MSLQQKILSREYVMQFRQEFIIIYELLVPQFVKNQKQIIVASCHVPVQGGKRAEYAENVLKQLEEMGENINCPVIAAVDFNCDIIKGNRIGFGFEVPRYDPTIHRVFCSGGNSNPCIDFFAYKNFGEDVAVKVYKVVAELACNLDNGVLSENKNKFLQYQQQLEKTSILDTIHEISDHDPLTALLTIKDSENVPIDKEEF